MGKTGTSALFIFSLLFTLFSGTADAQWRGPGRDGIYPGERLLNVWPDSGPDLLWFAEDIGKGFSSVAVTTDQVYVTGMAGGTGYLSAFDLKGNRMWKSAYGPEWDTDYPGARSTPVVVGNRIYLMSARGSVFCFDTDGKRIWSVDMVQQFGASQLRWGMTESLLADGDRIFCTPGGPAVAVACLNRQTGKALWKSKGNGEPSSYCSPQLVVHNNRRLIVTMTARSVIGVDADTGEFLWRHGHVTRYDVNPNTPLYHGGYIFTVSGYGTGGQKIRLNRDASSVEQVWTQAALDSQMGSAVLIDGFLYGSGQDKRGWHCVDWETGEVKYTKRVLGNKGNIIYADGMAYCYGENGDVGLVRLSPDAFEVVSSFKVDRGSDQHWAHLVIKQGRLFVRHGDALMVYDISAK